VKLNYGETVLTDELYDLRELTRALTEAFPQIEALYLFGSRRYRTGSPRSEVDILVGLGKALHIPRPAAVECRRIAVPCRISRTTDASGSRTHIY
jgi:hypothetical protein